jgi:hypothetical protein
MPEPWSFEERLAADGRTEYKLMFDDPQMANPDAIDVGMAISAAGNIHELKKAPAVLAAKQMVDMPDTMFLAPASDTEMVRSHGLTTFRRIMHVPAGVFGPRDGEPMTTYLSATGDNKADKLYVAAFNTPSHMWEVFQPVAKVMVENVLFGPQRTEEGR